MELLECKIYLAKYYEGTSSLEEEQDLRKFLMSYGGNDADLLEAKQIFAFNLNTQKEQVVLVFDDVINASRVTLQKPFKIRRIYMFSLAVAASVVMLVSLMFVFNSPKGPVVYAYVNGQAITDKTEAMQYAQNTMKTMSTSFNKGTQKLSYINQLNKPAALITVQ